MDIEQEQGGAVDQEGQEQQAPPPAPISIDYGQLAREIVGHASAADQYQQQQQIPDQREIFIRDLLANGADAMGLSKMVGLVEESVKAHLRQTEAKTEAQRQNEHLGKVWESLTAGLEDVAEALPQVEVAKESLQKQIIDVYLSDADFASDRMKVSREGALPSKSARKKVQEKVLDGFYKKWGLTAPAAPVKVRSNTPDPAPSTRGVLGAGDLSEAQKRHYEAFKKYLGPEKALERARRFDPNA